MRVYTTQAAAECILRRSAAARAGDARRRVRRIDGRAASRHAIAPGAPARRAGTYPRGKFPSAFVRIVSDGYLEGHGHSAASPAAIFRERDMPYSRAGDRDQRDAWRARCGPDRMPIGQIDASLRRDGAWWAWWATCGIWRWSRHRAIEMYLPMRQCRDISSAGSGGPDFAAPGGARRQRARRIEADRCRTFPAKSFRTLQQLVDKAVSPRRFVVLLLGGFALFALVLASLGIYGVISYG